MHYNIINLSGNKFTISDDNVLLGRDIYEINNNHFKLIEEIVTGKTEDNAITYFYNV